MATESSSGPSDGMDDMQVETKESTEVAATTTATTMIPATHADSNEIPEAKEKPIKKKRTPRKPKTAESRVTSAADSNNMHDTTSSNVAQLTDEDGSHEASGKPVPKKKRKKPSKKKTQESGSDDVDLDGGNSSPEIMKSDDLTEEASEVKKTAKRRRKSINETNSTAESQPNAANKPKEVNRLATLFENQQKRAAIIAEGRFELLPEVQRLEEAEQSRRASMESADDIVLVPESPVAPTDSRMMDIVEILVQESPVSDFQDSNLAMKKSDAPSSTSTPSKSEEPEAPEKDTTDIALTNIKETPTPKEPVKIHPFFQKKPTPKPVELPPPPTEPPVSTDESVASDAALDQNSVEILAEETHNEKKPTRRCKYESKN
jgi:hypothetical protein